MNSPQFLYQDSDIFAVYKPAGIHSVRLPTGGGESLADSLLAHTPSLSSASRTPGDAGLIQRLDHDTSGILLGAKNREAWNALFEELMAGRIEKRYVALVEGNISQETTLTSFIGSPHRGARKVKVYKTEPSTSARALPASTTISPIRYLHELNSSLIEASAPTARRHQIRAHCAFLGHPLSGDTLYGSTELLRGTRDSSRSFFLHAWKVCLAHPQTGKKIEIMSDYEPELAVTT